MSDWQIGPLIFGKRCLCQMGDKIGKEGHDKADDAGDDEVARVE
jgi:hypothetical protein